VLSHRPKQMEVRQDKARTTYWKTKCLINTHVNRPENLTYWTSIIFIVKYIVSYHPEYMELYLCDHWTPSRNGARAQRSFTFC
jgi:hypothetical protein